MSEDWTYDGGAIGIAGVAEDAADAPGPARIGTPLDFGRELTAARIRAGLTVRQVARAARLPVSTTGDYFSGAHMPGQGQTGQVLEILRACGVSDPAELAQWVDALGRARRPPGRRAVGDSPYRGLARFEPGDARWFFGREEITERLVALTQQGSLTAEPADGLPLVLVGASGSGKSSVLRAGLVPRLAGAVAIVEPSETPLATLEDQLGQITASGQTRPSAVIVDQFEAVFTQCEDESERHAFVSRICELAERSTVVLALRADFYGHALRYPGLAHALEARQVVLGPMSPEELRRVITGPARLARLDVAEGLIEILLRDLAPPARRDGYALGGAHEPGTLPLLSHALLATWEQSRGGVLTIADYVESGGIANALIRTAEGAYASLATDEQLLTRRLFLRLVLAAGDTPPVRAAVSLSELADWGGVSAEQVLSRFVDERLITVDASTAQITHDALIAEWPRLRSWIDAGMADLRTRRRITQGAQSWQDAGRESAALLRGSQLEIAREWVADADNRASLGQLAADFVAASVAEDAALRRAERGRARRLQRLVAALTALVLAVVGLAGYAFQQRQVAATARDNANSREIAIEAGQVRAQNAPLAAQLSVAAYGLAATPQATASLIESSGTPAAARLIDSAGVVESVSLSPDHTILAVAAADGTLRLWRVVRPGHPVALGTALMADASSPLYATAFSPNGKILAAAGAGRTIQVFDVSKPSDPVRLGPPLRGPANTIYSVAFSPDGRLLAAGSADDTVRLWDLADPARPAPVAGPLAGAAGYVQSVAFSPDGRLLAAGSADKTVRLWNVADPARPAPVGGPLSGPASPVTSVAFDRDGSELAAGSQDDKVWLWRLQPSGAEQDGTLTGATNWVNSVAFSPDGSTLAAGTSDASVLVWNVGTRSLAATLPHPQPVTSLAWDGIGRLAAGGADGTVSVWTLPSPVLKVGDTATSVAYSPSGTTLVVGGHGVELWNAVSRRLIAATPSPGEVVNGIAYSPTGNVIAAAYADGTVRLWRADARQLAPVGTAFQVTASGTAESVAFSPDGRLLATGSDDGTLRLFSVTDPARPRQLAVVHDSGTYVFTVAFAPDGKTVAAASTDNLTRLWNVADPAHPVLSSKPLAGPTSYAIVAAFSPDGKLLAVGSADKTVRLWNVSNPAHPTPVGAPLTGPTGYVWGLAFSPDGKTIAGGVTDGSVWLWRLADPARPALVATLTGAQGHVYSVAFSPSGRVLAATSDDGTVHLWDTAPAEALSAVCSAIGAPLTRQEWATYVPDVPYRAPCASYR